MLLTFAYIPQARKVVSFLYTDMSKINEQIKFYATLYMDMQKPVKLNDLHLIKKPLFGASIALFTASLCHFGLMIQL